MGDTGLEPGPSSSRVTHFLEDRNAPSDALTVNDPRLQLLIERWQALSPAVQQQIMLLVG
ncbi:MAG: hypothetical protein NZ847_06530 [Acidobacteria bacterium]|nr:hypothetical protein [Acidobacteriota bacterium]